MAGRHQKRYIYRKISVLGKLLSPSTDAGGREKIIMAAQSKRVCARERERWILQKLRARLIHQAAINRPVRPPCDGLRGRLGGGCASCCEQRPGESSAAGTRLSRRRNNRPAPCSDSSNDATANRSSPQAAAFCAKNLTEKFPRFSRGAEKRVSVRHTHTDSSTFCPDARS